MTKSQGSDVSDKVVMVMLVLVIVASVISLAVYLNAISEAKPQEITLTGKAIHEPQVKEAKQVLKAKGVASIQILPKEE
jgi:hypothetical protein